VALSEARASLDGRRRDAERPRGDRALVGRRSVRGGARLVLALALVAVSPAGGSLASPFGGGSPPLRTLVLDEGAGQILEDRWEIDCMGLREGLSCRFEGRTLVALSGRGGLARLASLVPVEALEVDGEPNDPSRITLDLPAREGALEVTQRGTLRPRARGYDDLVLPAIHARHLLMFDGHYPGRADVALFGPLAEHTAEGYVGVMIVRADPGGILEPEPRADRGLDRDEVEVAIRPEAFAGVTLATPGSQVHLGGIVLGLGWNLGGDEVAMRGRLGIEWGAWYWLVFGLSVDTDFADELVIAPYIELATPMLLTMPVSASVGVGAAFRALHELEAGARFIVGVNLLTLGFQATFDHYPGRADPWDTTLFLLISL